MVDRHMRRFRGLGVDRLRVSAFWDQIAPEPHAAAQAGLRRGLADRPEVQLLEPRPGGPVRRPARPPGDDLDHDARAALGDRRPVARRPPVEAQAAQEFALFARAIASRYGPQADQFAIMNEPNQPGWLQPQSDRRGYYAPHHYRRMVQCRVPRHQGRQPAATRSSSASSRRAAAATVGPELGHPAACVHARVRLRVALVPQAPLRPLPQLQGAAGGRDRPSPVPVLLASGPPLAPPRRRGDRRRPPAAALPRPPGAARPARLGPRRPAPGPLHRVRLPDRPARPVRGRPAEAPGPLAPGGRAPRVGTPRACTRFSQFRLTDGPVLPGGGFDAYREFQTGLLFHDMRKKPSYDSFRAPFIRQAARQARALLGPGPPRRPPRRDPRAQEGPLAGSRSFTVGTTRRGYWQRKARARDGTYRYRWGAGSRRTSDSPRVR